jgi:lipoyl(octanoyl) transferase
LLGCLLFQGHNVVAPDRPDLHCHPAEAVIGDCCLKAAWSRPDCQTRRFGHRGLFLIEGEEGVASNRAAGSAVGLNLLSVPCIGGATDFVAKSLESQRWCWLDSGPGGTAFNMALDEALLEAAPLLGRPVLRLYGWREAAASFGYFQKIAEIERITPLRPLVRRPTGGGLVPHAADWTYSLVFPAGHAWHSLRAPESYERVHLWLQRAFALLGAATELAPHSRKEQAGQCFAGYEQFDLLRLGRKMAGAAQRRTRSGLLVQGSVQPPPSALARRDWHQAMQQAAVELWAVEWAPLSLPASVHQQAEVLAAEKYSQDKHNRRR